MKTDRRTVKAMAVLAVLAAGQALAGTNGASSLFAVREGLPCHVGSYESRQWQWEALAGLEGVRAVVPHPEAGNTVYVIARDGLYRSDDFLVTWRHLPLESSLIPGEITTLAFRPGDPETFCFGTRSNGVWISRDGGKSAKRIGMKSAGMASDSVDTLIYAPDDPLIGTVLAGHGQAALGVSRGDTDDGTWTVSATGFHVFRLFTSDVGKLSLYVVASEAMTPEVIGFYFAPKLADFWQRVIQDALFSDVALMPSRDAVYVTTLDKGLFRVSQQGAMVQELGGADLEWFSAGVTWGSNGDEEKICFYQPTRHGFSLMTNDLADLEEPSSGLYRGTFASEGSHVRANAGGTRFYGAINGRLWVGRPVNACRVDTVTIRPSSVVMAASVMDGTRWRGFETSLNVFTGVGQAAPRAEALAAELRDLNRALPRAPVVVEAMVIATDNVPPLVTADLSRFGYGSETPLAPQGGGRYAVSFQLKPEGLKRGNREWRSSWPGAMPVTVTARGAQERAVGGVGVFSLYPRLEKQSFLKDSWALRMNDTNGTVRAKYEADPTRAASYRKAVKISAGPGPWEIAVGYRQFQWDVANYYALTFLIRSEGPADGELFVHLRDHPVYTDPTTTPAVPVVAGGYVTGGRLSTSGFCRVTIPVADLLKGSKGFFTDLFGEIVFAGTSAAPRIYWVDDIELLVSPKEIGDERRQGASRKGELVSAVVNDKELDARLDKQVSTLREQKQYKALLPVLDEAARTDDSPVRRQQWAFIRADLWNEQGKTAEALAAYERVFTDHPEVSIKWPDAQAKVVECLAKLGRLDDALKAARVAYDTALDDSVINRAANLIVDLLKQVDKGTARADAFTAMRRYGKAGRDKKPGTADDPAPVLAALGYPDLSARRKAFAAASATLGDGVDASIQRGRGFAYGGDLPMALAWYADAFRRCPAGRVGEIGKIVMVCGFMPLYVNDDGLAPVGEYLVLGPAGEDGKFKTADDLADPFAPLGLTGPTLQAGGRLPLKPEEVQALIDLTVELREVIVNSSSTIGRQSTACRGYEKVCETLGVVDREETLAWIRKALRDEPNAKVRAALVTLGLTVAKLDQLNLADQRAFMTAVVSDFEKAGQPVPAEVVSINNNLENTMKKLRKMAYH